MKKISLTTILVTTLVFGMLGFFTVVSAQESPAQPTAPTVGGAEAGSGCKIVDGREFCYLENPIGQGQKGTTEVSDIINIVIKAALGIIGAFTLLMFVWGGFQWLTSAGNPEKVTSGTQTMVWAVIGVVLVLSSYILLSTFLNFLT